MWSQIAKRKCEDNGMLTVDLGLVTLIGVNGSFRLLSLLHEVVRVLALRSCRHIHRQKSRTRYERARETDLFDIDQL